MSNNTTLITWPKNEVPLGRSGMCQLQWEEPFVVIFPLISINVPRLIRSQECYLTIFQSITTYVDVLVCNGLKMQSLFTSQGTFRQPHVFCIWHHWSQAQVRADIRSGCIHRCSHSRSVCAPLHVCCVVSVCVFVERVYIQCVCVCVDLHPPLLPS